MLTYCGSGFDAWQSRNFKFFPGMGIRKDGKSETQLLVSAFKSFHNVFVVKTYVLLIETCPLDGNIKSGGPLLLFDKNLTNANTDFLLSFSSLHAHHSHITSQGNTYTLILDIENGLQFALCHQ